MSKTVPLTLPEHVWGRLASQADTQGVDVPELIADAVKYLLEPTMFERRQFRRTVKPVDRLKVLEDELKAARKDGWRAPHPGSSLKKETRNK